MVSRSVFRAEAVLEAVAEGRKSSQGFAREIMLVEMEWVFMKESLESIEV